MSAVEIRSPGGSALVVGPAYGVDVTTGIASGTRYTGEYEVAPTGEAQVLHTALCTLERDLVIDPIPSNYGLVEWDGSVLTVS